MAETGKGVRLRERTWDTFWRVIVVSTMLVSVFGRISKPWHHLKTWLRIMFVL